MVCCFTSLWRYFRHTTTWSEILFSCRQMKMYNDFAFFSRTGSGGDTTALAIIIILCIVVCILSALLFFIIHQMRKTKSRDLYWPEENFKSTPVCNSCNTQVGYWKFVFKPGVYEIWPEIFQFWILKKVDFIDTLEWTNVICFPTVFF